MTTKLKLAIGAGVLLAIGGIAYARTRKPPRPTCKDGARWVPIEKTSTTYTNGSATVRAYIDKYGGLCMKTGVVTYAEPGYAAIDAPSASSFDVGGALSSFANGIGSFFSEPDKDELDDNGQPLITHPSQLD